jgi:hypothetical protein
MSEFNEIKNMFHVEKLVVPHDLKVRIEDVSYPNETNLRKIFLIIATSLLLRKGTGTFFDNEQRHYKLFLDDIEVDLHDKYIKLSNELKELEK